MFVELPISPLLRSIYQDIPFHDLEDFRELAPPEARADHVLLDEHQLMLNRLSFELAERQRYGLEIMLWQHF